ncbi:MAG: DUF2835 domain-containing protein [Alteromonadaceae bacterium]|nr:DUF2835 domain-containing protein [Alteromonadaceae bacterium]
MQQISVEISISAEGEIELYQGVATDVHTTARDGRSVRFPGRILSRFFLKDGIRGSFRILFDDAGKFVRIERL